METPPEPDLTLSDHTKARLQRNAMLACVSQGLVMALFPIATFSLFLTRELGVSLFDVFVLQAVFGLVVALLEVPSGYLADRVGYRVSMICGAVIGALGWAAYYFVWDFGSALCAEILLAISVSLLSGADTALLYESLRALGKQYTFTLWYSRFRATSCIAEGSAALIGAWLFASNVRAPFAVQTGIWLLNVVAVALMAEPPRVQGKSLPVGLRLASIARFALHGSPRLRAVFGLFLALSLPSYTALWLIAVYIERAGNDAALVGPIWAAASFAAAGSSLLVPWLERRFGGLSVLAVCVLLIPIGYAGLGLSYAAWGFAFYFALCIVRGLQMPILHREEQDLIPSSDRATLLSIRNLLFRGAFVVVGPLAGKAVDAYGMHNALLGGGFLFTLFAAVAWTHFAHVERPAHVPSAAL
jgi:MFS family permease